MGVLVLAIEDGLNPKKVASTDGGGSTIHRVPAAEAGTGLLYGISLIAIGAGSAIGREMKSNIAGIFMDFPMWRLVRKSVSHRGISLLRKFLSYKKKHPHSGSTPR